MDDQREDSGENFLFENNLESPTTEDEILFSEGQGQIVFENNFDDMDQMVGEDTKDVDQTVNYADIDAQKELENGILPHTGRTSAQAARAREERLLHLRKPRQVSADNINSLARLTQFFESSGQDSEKYANSLSHNLDSSGGLRHESESLSLTMNSSRGLVEGDRMQNRTAGTISQVGTGISSYSQAGLNNFGDEGAVVAGPAPEQGQLVVRCGQTGGGVSGNFRPSQLPGGFSGGQSAPHIMTQHQAMMGGVRNTGGGVSGNVDPSQILAGFSGGQTGTSIVSEFQAMMGGTEGTEGGVSGGVTQRFTRYVEGQQGAFYMSQAQTQTIISRDREARGGGNRLFDPSQIPPGFRREYSYMPQFQNHTTIGGGQEGTNHLSQAQNQTMMAGLGGGGERSVDSMSSLMTFPGGIHDEDLMGEVGGHFEDMGSNKDDASFMRQLEQLLGYEAIRAQNNKFPRSRGMCTVIILDTSSSMMGEPISEAGQFISQFLDGLEEAQFEHELEENVAIICASGEIHVLQHLTKDYAALRRAVDTVYAEGRSHLQFAIMLPLSVLILDPLQGIDYIGHIHGHRICPRVIIITDGHPAARRDIPGQESPVVEERDAVMFQSCCVEMLDHIRKRTLCDVYCVPVGNANTEFLSSLAACGGGHLIETTEARKLSRTFLHHYVVGNLLKMDVDISDRETVAAVVHSTLNCSDEQDVESVMDILARGEPNLEDRDRKIAEEIHKAEQAGFDAKGNYDGQRHERTGIEESEGHTIGYTSRNSDHKSQEKVGIGNSKPEISGRADMKKTQKQDQGSASREERYTECIGESEGIFMNGFGDISDIGIGQTGESCQSDNFQLGLHSEKQEYDNEKKIIPQQHSVRTVNGKTTSKSPDFKLSTSNNELQSLGLGLVNVSDEDENLDRDRAVKLEHGLNNKFGLMDLGSSPDVTRAPVNIISQRASRNRALQEWLRQRKLWNSLQSSLSKSTDR